MWKTTTVGDLTARDLDTKVRIEHNGFTHEGMLASFSPYLGGIGSSAGKPMILSIRINHGAPGGAQTTLKSIEIDHKISLDVPDLGALTMPKGV